MFAVKQVGLIPERLLQLREQKKLTQGELAVLAGTTHATISRYEKGEFEPSALTLYRLAEALGTTIDYLTGRSNDVTASVQESDLSEDEFKLLMAFRSADVQEVMRLTLERTNKPPKNK